MQITVNWNLFDHPITLIGDFDPGSPGRYSGPPEDCYPDDPPCFSIEKAYLDVSPGKQISIDLNDEKVYNMLEELALDEILCSAELSYGDDSEY